MTLNPKPILIATLLALACLGLVPVFASAQGNLDQLKSIKATPTENTNLVNPSSGGLVVCGNGASQGDSCTLYDLFTIFARVINFLLAVAGLFAVFQIVRAGQSMVLAFGNPESLTTAKNSLTNAVLGFALVMIAYLLIYFVVYAALGIKTRQNNPINLFFHPVCYLTDIRGEKADCIKPDPDPGGGGNPPPGGSVKSAKFVSTAPPPEDPCDPSAQNNNNRFPWIKTAHGCIEPGEEQPGDCSFDSQPGPTYLSITGRNLHIEVGHSNDMTVDNLYFDLVLLSSSGQQIASKIFSVPDASKATVSVSWTLPDLQNGTYRVKITFRGEETVIDTWDSHSVIVDTRKTLADCPGGPGSDPNSAEQPVGGGSYPPSGRCLASQVAGPRETACSGPEELSPPLVRVNDYVPSVVMKDGQYVHPGTIAIIKKINDHLNFSPSFRVTEAYPPYAHHSSVCHYNGRCIDISPFPGALERQEEAIRYFKLYCKAIKAAGVTSFENETGLPETVSECGALKTFTFTNGAHIHVKLHK